MKKAFEKILERLDECIATRNESLADNVFKNGIRHAKTIVQEVADEYNGGLIPCSGCKDCKNKECKHYGKV